jgi:hypothetical protein
MNEENGVMKIFLGGAIMVMFGFMLWAVLEHYHDEHGYDQRGVRILRGLDRHDDRNDRQHNPYYCPDCRRSVNSCPHYRRYDPYYNKGYYYCPDCNRLTRGCAHSRYRNPYFGIEIDIR